MPLSRGIGTWGRWRGWLARNWRFVRVRRRPRFEAALLIAVVLLVDAGLLWEARRAALEEARATARNLAGLLAEQTSTAFKTTDLALRAARLRLERENLPQDDAGFRSDLKMMSERLDYVRALFVIGPDGYITHDTDYPDTPRANLADRSYFSVLRDNPTRSFYIGDPLLSRSVFRWFVPVSLRIEQPDGTFRGVVVAAVESLFFEHTYSRLHLNQHDAIALFNADSTLIARVPSRTALYGKQLEEFQLFTAQLSHAGRGVYEVGSSLTGRASIIGYEKLADFPLIVTTVLDKSEALAGWKLFFWVIVLASIAISTLILLLYSILERRRLERQVARQKALMHEKLEAIGFMTSGVAHDFKNLLAAVLAGTRLLQRRGADERVFASIEEAVDRGNRLTADLLQFAKDQNVERCTFIPNEQIERLVPLLRQTARSDVRLILDLAPDVGAVNVSSAQFDAAIANLAVNAMHAMPNGGKLHISTGNASIADDAILPRGEYVRISVADTGCGIAPDALKEIFEPFVTSKGTQGTGLGLFQVRRFATEAGGDVRVASEVGKGTNFDILLPVAPVDRSTPLADPLYRRRNPSPEHVSATPGTDDHRRSA
jgi:signal transduction histidine kinase